MTEHMAAYKYEKVVLIIPCYKYVVTIVWILLSVLILYTIFRSMMLI